MGEREADDAIPIWPDMTEAFALFCDAPWQWVGLGMAGAMRTGINRSELEAVSRLTGIPLTPAIYSDIRVMEAEAMRVWARK